MKPISIRRLKHDRVRSYLRGKLLLLPDGAPLPGLRAMMAECGAGRKVLEKAIAEAEADGLLRRKARSGFFRAESFSGERPDFLICVANAAKQLSPVGSGNIPSFFSRIILSLQDKGRREGLRSCLVTRLDELPRLPVPLFCVGITDPGELRRAETEWPRTVTISGLPGRLWVKPVYEEATRAGLEYLVSLGHRAIGYTYYRHPDPAIRDRHLFEYYRFMAEHGYKVEPSFVVAYPDEKNVECGIEKMFSAARTPTAFFAQTVWLPTVYRVLKRMKVNIPWQVSILGLGNMEFMERLSPFPAFVGESATLMAEKAWDLMFNTSVPEGVVTPPLHVLDGASCRRPPGRVSVFS